ncbi:MAG: DUF962 domain-containing protein [Flavobacteriia bacterium]|nr:DUF962 domain-containing protein [Flavobacteriia bacterium]
MRTLDSWFAEYSESHQNPLNKLIHWICVPSIFFSILALVSSIPAQTLQNLAPESMSWFVNWGTLLLIFVLIFYFRLSIPMGVAMTAFSVLCIIGVEALRVLPFPVWATSLAIFVAAWIGQFYGHKVEGKKPSFLKDLQFLLIGPAWLMGFIFKRVGARY